MANFTPKLVERMDPERPGNREATRQALDLVNNWALRSCPANNRNPFSRRINRQKYRDAAQTYWEGAAHRRLVAKYFRGYHDLDTYPWPYSDYRFADWEECADNDGYNLISDQSDFVIRHSTSYCAYKIFELTGKWPKKYSVGYHAHAKNWQQFLYEAGYKQEVINLIPSQHYVGIAPTYGEFGLVVWAEGPVNETTHTLYVSTYLEKHHHYFEALVADYIWIQIEAPATELVRSSSKNLMHASELAATRA